MSKKKKPKIRAGGLRANRAQSGGHRRSKFNFQSRLSDGKTHPVVVKRVEDR